MSTPKKTPAQELVPTPPPPKTFVIGDLSEGEMTFIVNAVHSVQIESKDAKVVAELQTRLVNILTGQ